MHASDKGGSATMAIRAPMMTHLFFSRRIIAALSLVCYSYADCPALLISPRSL
jgi:hypothetical protein